MDGCSGSSGFNLGSLLIYQNNHSHAGAALIGSGAGLILAGNLGMLGKVFGGVTNRTRAQVAKKTINTLQDIEASRQAYEDSQLMYGFLKSYSNKSDKLLSTILTLSSDAKDLMGVAPSAAKAKSIVELCDKTREALEQLQRGCRINRTITHIIY